MEKIYQPEILKLASTYMDVLEETNFFGEFEIKNMGLVKENLCDRFTQKFIDGDLTQNLVFTSNEWNEVLKEIIKNDVFDSLKNKGILNSYSDENTEETFFLTEIGKGIYKKLNDIE